MARTTSAALTRPAEGDNISLLKRKRCMAAQQPRSLLWIDKDLRSQSPSNRKKDAAGRGAIDLFIQAWRSEARRSPSKVLTERLCQIFWVRSEDRPSLYLLSSELTLTGTKTVHRPGAL